MIDPADEDAIADAVDEWHHDDCGMPLHEFLGWTLEAYRAWMEQRPARRPLSNDPPA